MDDRIEDATEILRFMKEQAKEYKDIFRNPATLFPLQPYSWEAKKTLKHHTVLYEFIKQHEIEQRQRLSSVSLPENFYDDLEEYLWTLNDIGCFSVDKETREKKRKDLWNFSDNELGGLCAVAQARFFKDAIDSLTEKEKEAYEYKMITVPVRGSNSSVEERLCVVAVGEGGYKCVKTKQVFLNYFLKQHKPSWIIPDTALSCKEASYYILDPSFQAGSDFGNLLFNNNFNESVRNNFLFQDQMERKVREFFVYALTWVIILTALYNHNHRGVENIFVTLFFSYITVRHRVSEREYVYTAFQLLRNYFNQNREIAHQAPLRFLLGPLMRGLEQVFRIDPVALEFFRSRYLGEQQLNPIQPQQPQTNNNLIVLYRAPNFSETLRHELGQQLYFSISRIFLASIYQTYSTISTLIERTHAQEEAPTSSPHNETLYQSQAVIFYQPRTVAVRQPSLTLRLY